MPGGASAEQDPLLAAAAPPPVFPPHSTAAALSAYRLNPYVEHLYGSAAAANAAAAANSAAAAALCGLNPIDSRGKTVNNLILLNESECHIPYPL